jgi:hypothetical protein
LAPLKNKAAAKAAFLLGKPQKGFGPKVCHFFVVYSGKTGESLFLIQKTFPFSPKCLSDELAMSLA